MNEASSPKQRGKAADTGSLLYLYAVLPQGAPAEALLDAGRIPGVHPAEPLFPLRAAGFVAAVSKVPARQFREDALNAMLRDMSRVGPYALRHNEAIHALLMDTPALIPLAFGAVYVSENGIVALLESNAERFRALLQELAGKEEWTLKVYVDPARISAAAEAASSDARRLGEEAAASTPGRGYLARKQRAQILAKEAARLEAEALQDTLHSVEAVAAAVRLDDLPERDVSAETLALKAALLVEGVRVDELRSQVVELQSRYAPGLKLEASGPWPPYSFVGSRR